MQKELTKEVKFGKAIAKVTVSMFTNKVHLDGDHVRDEVLSNATVEIVAPNGKVVESASHADILEFNPITENLFNKLKLDRNQKYTRVGDKAMTPGEEAGLEIAQAIEEMKEELSSHFEEKTEEAKQEEKTIQEEIEVAKEVVAIAEKEGVENLLSDEELKQWKKNYNDVNNEGGEGYIPARVSKEEHARAIRTIALHEMKESIKNLMLDESISNYRISKETGIAQTTLSRFARDESDVGNMSLNNALKLYDFYNKIHKKH